MLGDSVISVPGDIDIHIHIHRVLSVSLQLLKGQSSAVAGVRNTRRVS